MDETSDASGARPRAELAPATFLRSVVAPAFAREIDALRDRIATLERDLAEREAAEASVGLRTTGVGGEIWYLTVRGGRMEVEAKPSAPVLFSVYQSVEDWYALAGEGAMIGGSGVAAPGSRSPFSATRVARLRTIAGTVRVVLRDDADRDRAVTLHFGGGEPLEPPPTTVTLRAADARRLRDGTLDPQAAFLQGLVGISGDIGLAVQLGTALFL